MFHFYYSFDMFEIVYKQKYFFQHVIKNADAKERQALFNCADILFYLNFDCKLQPILLWSIVKRNPRLRIMFNRRIEVSSMKPL